ncbi:MAG TPA: hypothetical protein VHH55_01415 [Gaiellaceae bacterium]|jgi:hypothetical protein|nr:hypothetical protein [Gaiellaceae bacterium]
MDEPHVHLFIRRSAEYGGRIGPVALAAAAGGFLIWLITLDASPRVGAVAWLVGLGAMLVALSAALASAVGLLFADGRAYAVRGLVTGALGILVPAGVAFVVITFVWQ